MLIEARGRMGALHGLGEAIATLDLVVSLAHSAALGSWVRPEFSRALAIRCGRHPILDVLALTPPVPNNTVRAPRQRCIYVVNSICWDDGYLDRHRNDQNDDSGSNRFGLALATIT